MGRIKTTLVKRTTERLLEETPESFDSSFENNKKALGNTMPSKRLRNMVAGFLARKKKNIHKILNTEEVKND